MPSRQVQQAARLTLERAALRLLEPDARTCRGALARDARGRPVATTSRRAVRWSPWGCVLRELATRRLHVTTENKVLQAIRDATWNAMIDAHLADPADPPRELATLLELVPSRRAATLLDAARARLAGKP